MEPITFFLLMWFSWGAARMFFPGTFSRGKGSSPRGKAPGSTAKGSGPGRATPKGPRPSAKARAKTWAKRANASADKARNIDWGSPEWWGRALLGSAWTPLRDLFKAARWAHGKVHKRRQATQAHGPTFGPTFEPQPDTGEHSPPSEAPAAPKPDESPDFEVVIEVIRPDPPILPELSPPTPAASATGTPKEGTPMSEMVPTGGGVAVGNEGASHDASMANAGAIISTITSLREPLEHAASLIKAAMSISALQVDGMHANGVGGAVVANWMEVLGSLDAMVSTGRRLCDEADAAASLAAQARTYQASIGGAVQEVIASAGTQVANRTDYY